MKRMPLLRELAGYLIWIFNEADRRVATVHKARRDLGLPQGAPLR